ncbi:hypothetical protein BRC96_08690 [Halobacteriales archaeon QS_6_64_34]|nr:MAG: hypothetical protein BRC96_08690 [Halobacteriales archaeon QS_6_64_34]
MFVDASQTVQYLEPSGTVVELGGVGSNNGLGAGPPAMINGTLQIPTVTGSNEVALLGTDGRETLTDGVAAKSPPTAADVDSDEAQEIVFVSTSGTLNYVDDVGATNSIEQYTSDPVPAADDLGVLSPVTVNTTNWSVADGESGPVDSDEDADNSSSSNASVTMEESGAIQLTIDQTVDPVRTGNETLIYPISGNISMNPSPEPLGNVTITINGNRTVTTQPQTAGVSSEENISYGTTVNLTERVNTIDVRVGLAPGNSSEGQAQNDNAGENEGQPQNNNTGENEPNSADTTGNVASATLYLDGDGLPAADEQQVIGTDPLDFDSDSNMTESDEADNGTIDGREDFDGDGLGTLQERELGTDPLNADTDGDGLTDGEEYILTETGPLILDSDDDGTLDALEDPDGDSLTHTAELANGTDPLYADIDNDGLDDAAELDNETNPLVFDTDSDGLSDGTELTASFGTDPTDPDTDGDGIEDGNETFTTETENESLGVSIELTGQGNLASNSTVEPATHARFTAERAPNESLVGSPVYVDVGGNLSEATVTTTYNESAISSNESSVALYRFNETTGAYHRLPSTVDPQNNTVSANTSHFSVIVPFDSVQAIDTATQQAQLSEPTFDGGNQAFEFDTTEAITIDSGNSTTVNGATWTCRNDPRTSGASDSPVLGVCEFRNGSAYVEEETNRMRYLEHTLTLPDSSSNTDVFIQTSSGLNRTTEVIPVKSA